MTIYFIAMRPAIEKALYDRIYFSHFEALDALTEIVENDASATPWRIFAAEVVNVHAVTPEPPETYDMQRYLREMRG